MFGDNRDGDPVFRQLIKHGADHVTITVGHLAKLIEAYFGNGSQFGVQIDYSHEPSPLGTMGPLKLIKNLPENFLVLNGDVLTDLSFSEFFKKHCENKHPFSISSYKREINSDFGVLEINEKYQLVGFREKPKIPFEVSMGIYAMNYAVLEEIPPNKPFGFDELMLYFLAQGKIPHVYNHSGFWLDIGRPEDYEQAQLVINDLKGDLF
jgi:NDP-sugar pyrophosphorylase family protein